MTFEKKGGLVFGGVGCLQPQMGDLVEILEGSFQGEKFIVFNTSGNINNPVLKVHIMVQNQEYWYWPWNLKIIKRAKDV